MNSKYAFITLGSIVGIIILIMMTNSILSARSIPSLGDYVASSTDAFSSTTTAFASSSPVESVSKREVVPTDQSSTTLIRAPHGTIQAFRADTPEAQELGLGNRASLPPYQGMLFTFDAPGTYGFWMKDMQFPIDMVWIGADKKIHGISSNVSPDTYPKVIFPPNQILYVLEINAGMSSQMKLATDTQLSF